MSSSDPDETTSPVIVTCGSLRTGSFNEQLARLTVDELNARGVAAEFVDLGDYTMPLLDPDVVASDGPPPVAHELRERIGRAPAVVIVSPEYNGAMTPLLKNTIDWVSRVDLAVLFGKRVVLMAATPGRRGGTNVLDITSRWLGHMGAEVHTETFGLPSSRHVLVDGALLDGHDERLAVFLDGVSTWLREPPAVVAD